MQASKDQVVAVFQIEEQETFHVEVCKDGAYQNMYNISVWDSDGDCLIVHLPFPAPDTNARFGWVQLSIFAKKLVEMAKTEFKSGIEAGKRIKALDIRRVLEIDNDE